MPLIVLDAGHGGANPGAVYEGRQEKDDALSLTLAVGRILENRGVDVYYTRTSDIYESPAQKALEGNQVGADYFVSIHRNSSPYPNQYSGVESLVYNRYGAAAQMAYNINQQLEAVGFLNQGVNERTNLVVLNRTQMPAVLVEVGFINTDADNQLFDAQFYDIAQAIADGILITLGM
ncbi:MAG: N-acetylmuramoyl-L-alanine amidase [Acetatifactor sp.]|nr:N-acetylmuramoyl-L-alanine amidase [Acetatifactor sp.]